MSTLFFIIFLLSITTLIYFVVRWIISHFSNKTEHAKKMRNLTIASAGVMFFALIRLVSLSTFFYTVSFLSTLLLIYFIVRFIIFKANNNDVQRLKYRKFSWIAFAVIFVSIAASANTTETDESKKIATSAPVMKEEVKSELTEEEKTEAQKIADEKKAAIELKVKQDAIAKAKDEDEDEAKELSELRAKEKDDKKANAQTIPYAQLKKDPDQYTGEYVTYTGEIMQILEDNNMTNIRLSVIEHTYGYSVSDLIFVEYAGYTDFADGDIVTIYGDVYGAYIYESQVGFNISLPGILAEEVVSQRSN